MDDEEISYESLKFIIIGGGLAGLSVTLQLNQIFKNLPHKPQIILIEKEPKLGGNSAKVIHFLITLHF